MTDYPVTPGNLWEPPGIPGSPQDPTVAGSRNFHQYIFFQILSEEKFPVGFQIIRHWQTTEYLNILDIFKRCWFLIILNQQKT